MKPNEQALSHERLIEALSYDPETGIFIWKQRNYRAAAGDIAGTIIGRGYRCIGIDGHRYPAHRLAWFYVHRRWPVNELDHENLRRDDNWIDNLREVTTGQNKCNCRTRKHNVSGLKGAFKRTGNRSGYVAKIVVDRKVIYLGSFETAEDAHAAYARASLEHHGEFGRVA